MPLINRERFKELAEQVALGAHPAIGFDFETTGLHPHKGDRAFIMGIAVDGEKLCVRDMDKETMAVFFGNPKVRYLAHNAKFEMTFLKAQWGVEIKGTVWDTEAMARLEYNAHMRYGLQECAKRIGLSKHEPMLEWLKKKGNKGKYHLAPADIIEPYVERDAYLSLALYEVQRTIFKDWILNSPLPPTSLITLELKTTKNLFKMESAGLLVDVPYCKEALEYEIDRENRALAEFKKLTGKDLVMSAKCLQPIFDAEKLPYGQTELGNPSFNDDSLSLCPPHPIVDCIRVSRNASKRASSYWSNFVKLECGGIIYPNIRQPPADTGRMSIKDPSANNFPDDSDDPTCKYPIRKAFIAWPGCSLVSMDYRQMEYRFIADEAGDMKAIHAIQEGEDVHGKLATYLGLPRGLVKNAVFAKLYGAGPKKLSKMLGISIQKAKDLADKIDETAPRITEYSDELIEYARHAPYGYNFMGRRFFFERGFEYKYPDYRVQGGCSDMLRIAIDRVLYFLEKNAKGNTKLLIPIHDELLFNWDEVDADLIPRVRDIMIDAHVNKRFLSMDVSIAKGPNWHDLN